MGDPPDFSLFLASFSLIIALLYHLSPSVKSSECTAAHAKYLYSILCPGAPLHPFLEQEAISALVRVLYENKTLPSLEALRDLTENAYKHRQNTKLLPTLSSRELKCPICINPDVPLRFLDWQGDSITAPVVCYTREGPRFVRIERKRCPRCDCVVVPGAVLTKSGGKFNLRDDYDATAFCLSRETYFTVDFLRGVSIDFLYQNSSFMGVADAYNAKWRDIFPEWTNLPQSHAQRLTLQRQRLSEGWFLYNVAEVLGDMNLLTTADFSDSVDTILETHYAAFRGRFLQR